MVAGFPGGISEEMVDGYRVIRLGNRWTIYWHAFWYYRRQLAGWADLVIDEMNTLPFFARFYVKEKNILLAYQLCREIWFYQMHFPLNYLGYWLEPLYLKLLSDRYVITESISAKKDMVKYGFKPEKISVIPVGLDIKSVQNANKIKKFTAPTILYLGSLREMKRPHHVIAAFALAKKNLPDLRLKMAGAGSGRYLERIKNLIKSSPYAADIEYLGPVSRSKKRELMQKSHLICVTSVKEGWGLIITEANSQGTPAVVYDIDGLRDACHHQRTGLVCAPVPEQLARAILKILPDKKLYRRFSRQAWQDSFNYNYDRTYQVFIKTINHIIKSLN